MCGACLGLNLLFFSQAAFFLQKETQAYIMLVDLQKETQTYLLVDLQKETQAYQVVDICILIIFSMSILLIETSTTVEFINTVQCNKCNTSLDISIIVM